MLAADAGAAAGGAATAGAATDASATAGAVAARAAGAAGCGSTGSAVPSLAIGGAEANEIFGSGCVEDGVRFTGAALETSVTEVASKES